MITADDSDDDGGGAGHGAHSVAAMFTRCWLSWLTVSVRHHSCGVRVAVRCSAAEAVTKAKGDIEGLEG